MFLSLAAGGLSFMGRP